MPTDLPESHSYKWWSKLGRWSLTLSSTFALPPVTRMFGAEWRASLEEIPLVGHSIIFLLSTPGVQVTGGVSSSLRPPVKL